MSTSAQDMNKLKGLDKMVQVLNIYGSEDEVIPPKDKHMYHEVLGQRSDLSVIEQAGHNFYGLTVYDDPESTEYTLGDGTVTIHGTTYPLHRRRKVIDYTGEFRQRVLQWLSPQQSCERFYRNTLYIDAHTPRWVDVEGIANFRDLGGWCVGAAKRVRPRLMFRGARGVRPPGTGTCHQLPHPGVRLEPVAVAGHQPLPVPAHVLVDVSAGVQGRSGDGHGRISDDFRVSERQPGLPDPVSLHGGQGPHRGGGDAAAAAGGRGPVDHCARVRADDDRAAAGPRAHPGEVLHGTGKNVRYAGETAAVRDGCAGENEFQRARGRVQEPDQQPVRGAARDDRVGGREVRRGGAVSAGAGGGGGSGAGAGADRSEHGLTRAVQRWHRGCLYRRKFYCLGVLKNFHLEAGLVTRQYKWWGSPAGGN
ncbi:hypothetical protein KL921_002854 [Ogataea angusta]|nr:hypothetical protein KL921_002854 [Ogataea angusta]